MNHTVPDNVKFYSLEEGMPEVKLALLIDADPRRELRTRADEQVEGIYWIVEYNMATRAWNPVAIGTAP